MVSVDQAKLPELAIRLNDRLHQSADERRIHVTVDEGELLQMIGKAFQE